MGKALQTQNLRWFRSPRPGHHKQSLGGNLWWRWLKETNNPWTKLWKQMYAMDWQEKDHIQMTGHIRGSHVWNKAWENRTLVQNHSF